MEFSSKLIEKAVNEMSQLPGIGANGIVIGTSFIKAT
jgi:hypothetical protein